MGARLVEAMMMHIGAWGPRLLKDPVQLLAIRQVKHPTEGGSAKAKAADSACPVPTSPAWPCRQHVGSESGPAHHGVCRYHNHPVWSWLGACRNPLVGGPGSSPPLR